MTPFTFLFDLDPKDAVAGVHFAMRSITHRRLWAGEAGEPAGGQAREAEVGLKIIGEIERDARVRLSKLSDARAERYKQALLDTAFELTKRKLKYEKGAGEKLLRERRPERDGSVITISIPLPFSKPKSVSVGAYLILLTAAFVYLLVSLWPATGVASGGGPSPSPVSLLGGFVQLLLGPETRVLLLVIVSGVLGSCVYAAANYAAMFRRRELAYGRYWFFLVRPVSGAVLAPLVYFLLRAGFLQPTADVRDLNVFGLIAFSALSGMYSEQAMSKLREVSEVLFGAVGPQARGGQGGSPRVESAPPVAPAARVQSEEGKAAPSEPDAPPSSGPDAAAGI